MPDLNKSFRLTSAPKYFYISASGSQGAVWNEEDLDHVLGVFLKQKVDVRVYTLAEQNLNSHLSQVATEGVDHEDCPSNG
jgi:hypothetical protein